MRFEKTEGDRQKLGEQEHAEMLLVAKALEENPGVTFDARDTRAEQLFARSEKRKTLSRRLKITPVDQERLMAARQGFATRRLDLAAVSSLIDGPIRPRPGDVVLARVDRLRYHRRIELPNGRKANLHTGDEIIVAYGNRYATDQYEGVVPFDLAKTNLIATGGVAATMLGRNSAMRSATDITPIGLLGNERGDPINLRDLVERGDFPTTPRPQTIAILGTSMNSGKTTVCKSLIRGLRAAGKRVAGLKITGTGSGGDYWAMVDAGAQVVADFTDAGYPSTYKVALQELEQILLELLALATRHQVDVAVIEIAEGIYQAQNMALMASPTFQEAIDRVVFAAGDSLGAAQGLRYLQEASLPVVAVSGRLTMSELSVRETSGVCDLPILSRRELESPFFATTQVLEAEIQTPPKDGLSGVGGDGPSVFKWAER